MPGDSDHRRPELPYRLAGRYQCAGPRESELGGGGYEDNPGPPDDLGTDRYVEFIAEGGAFFRVFVDGTEYSKHTTQHKAQSVAAEQKTLYPDSEVYYEYPGSRVMAKTSVIVFPQSLSTVGLTGQSANGGVGDFTVEYSSEVALSSPQMTHGVANLGVITGDNISVGLQSLLSTSSLGAVTAVTQNDVAPVITSTPNPSFIEGVADTYDMSQHWTDDGLSTVTSFLTPSTTGSGVTYNTNTHELAYDGVGSPSSTSHTLTAQDAVGSDTSASFNIEVIAANQLTTVDIVGTGTGAVTFGHLFAEGDATTVQMTGAQVNAKTTWPDGSVRFAVISGVFTGGSAYPIYSGASGGTNLTEAQLISALGTTTITLSGSISGTLNAADLISGAATPAPPGKIAWQDGPHCIERIVGAQISGTVYGFFHCRYYSNGALSVDFVVENCEAISAAANSIAGVSVDFVLNGSSVYSDASQTLYNNSRFMETFWGSDPGLYAAPDLDYFYSTKATPKYYANTTSNTYTTSVNWDSIGDLRSNWGGTGFHPQIGPLPEWDVAAIRNSFSSIDSVIANAKAFNHSSVSYKDNARGYPVDFQVYPNADIFGWDNTVIQDGTGTALTTSTGFSHGPEEGFLAYVLTGKYYFLETMWYCGVKAAFQMEGSGEFADRRDNFVLRPGDGVAPRANAWTLRTVGRNAFLAPDGNTYSDQWSVFIENTFDYLNTNYVSVVAADHNVFGIYRGRETTSGFMRPWMYDFQVGAILEIARMGLGGTNNDAVAEWTAQWVQERSSYQGDTTSWCWQYGPSYDYGDNLPYSGSTWVSDWTTYYNTVWPGTTCDINGSTWISYPNGPNGYAGNMFYPVAEAHGLGHLNSREYQRHLDALDQAQLDTEIGWVFGTRGSDFAAPSWVTSMPLNTWQQHGTNTFTSVQAADIGQYQNTGPAAVLIAWGSAAFASGHGNKGAMIHWGGGHQDYFGNEVYAFDLETRTWSRLNEPSPNFPPPSGVGIYADGTPAVPHTYFHLDYRPSTNSLLAMGRGVADSGFTGTDWGMSIFDLDTETWFCSTASIGNAGEPQQSPSGIYDAVRDTFWHMGTSAGLAWSSYNFTTDSWTAYNGLGAPFNDGRPGVFCTEKDCAVNFVQGAIKVFDPSNPSSPPVDMITSGSAPTVNAYDSAQWSGRDNCIYYYPGKSSSIYKLAAPTNPFTGTWQWTQLSLSGSASVYGPDAGTCEKFRVIDYDDATIAAMVSDPDGQYNIVRLS